MTEARRFRGGRVFTGRRFVESLLVDQGRVVAVGTEAQVARTSPTGCEVEDLGGGLAVPGLVDAHLHLLELVRAEEGLRLEAVRSRAELTEALRTWASAHPKGPIVGRGWTVDAWDVRVEPTRRELEVAVDDRPVILYQASGHAAVVNGAALEAAGYTEFSVDPPGGRLGREVDGALDGRVFERALEPIGRVARTGYVPDPGVVRRTFGALAAGGLTAVGTLSTDLEELEFLSEKARADELPFRVRAYVRASRLREIDLRRDWDGHRGALLDVRGTKSFADGAFGPHTAWLTEPYEDRPESLGDPTLSSDDLDDIVRRTVKAGLTPAVHAIGDRAVVEVLRAFEGVRPHRGAPRIEHAALLPPELHADLDRVRPTLVVQPGFVWSDWWLEGRLGPQRARWAYPFRTLLERGHLLVGSSDAPYDPPDPWRGLAAAVHRTDPQGRSANPAPSESLLPVEAFQMYTTNAGLGLGEPELGSLEPGARADLVVLSHRDLGSAIESGRAGVRSTWCGGRRIFDRTAPGAE